MIRFVTQPIFTGLVREAVLGYIQQGKGVPQTWDEVEEMLLTVMNPKELKVYEQRPWIDAAAQDLVLWLLSDNTLRIWFAGCELGREVVEAQKAALAS